MKEYIMKETEEQITFGSVWKKFEPTEELVRCKNCKYRDIDKRQNGGRLFPCMFTSYPDDWYCADGKREQS